VAGCGTWCAWLDRRGRGGAWGQWHDGGSGGGGMCGVWVTVGDATMTVIMTRGVTAVYRQRCIVHPWKRHCRRKGREREHHWHGHRHRKGHRHGCGWRGNHHDGHGSKLMRGGSKGVVMRGGHGKEHSRDGNRDGDRDRNGDRDGRDGHRGVVGVVTIGRVIEHGHEG